MFVKVRVTTAQRKEKVERTAEDRFDIAVKEKPEQNAANVRVLTLLAAALAVPVNKIRFVSGHHAPSKLFEVRD
jgi:uncharacterized protein YggU (UPF0235/DUF167 family)